MEFNEPFLTLNEFKTIKFADTDEGWKMLNTAIERAVAVAVQYTLLSFPGQVTKMVATQAKMDEQRREFLQKHSHIEKDPALFNRALLHVEEHFPHLSYVDMLERAATLADSVGRGLTELPTYTGDKPFENVINAAIKSAVEEGSVIKAEK